MRTSCASPVAPYCTPKGHLLRFPQIEIDLNTESIHLDPFRITVEDEGVGETDLRTTGEHLHAQDVGAQCTAILVDQPNRRVHCQLTVGKGNALCDGPGRSIDVPWFGDVDGDPIQLSHDSLFIMAARRMSR